MNRPLVGIIFIIIAIIFSVTSLFYIKQTKETMIESFNLALESAASNNQKETEKHIKTAIQQWEKHVGFLNIIVGQNETNNLKTPLSMAYKFVLLGDTESVILYINECKTEIERIENINEPTLSTIL